VRVLPSARFGPKVLDAYRMHAIRVQRLSQQLFVTRWGLGKCRELGGGSWRRLSPLQVLGHRALERRGVLPVAAALGLEVWVGSRLSS
jgi:hypothetical protein